ncbi:hypothetical protein BH24DEI2_BH24DEI2_16330 [soil metagenome]
MSEETVRRTSSQTRLRPARVLLSAPVLAGVLIALAGGVAVLRSVPTPRPSLVQVETSPDAPVGGVENIELVLLERGEGERAVEHPVFVDMELPTDPARRFAALTAALRAQAGPVWPDTLSAPTAFAVETANGTQTVAVLDFTVDAEIALDVETEELLVQSIESTRLRNGADRVQILVNHQESTSFLGHVALASVLEN